jgi:hypothetical protein
MHGAGIDCLFVIAASIRSDSSHHGHAVSAIEVIDNQLSQESLANFEVKLRSRRHAGPGLKPLLHS